MRKSIRNLSALLNIIFIIFFVTSCKSKIPSFELGDKNDYSDYSQYYLDTLDNFYLQEEESYAVYFYGTSCTHCNDIKNSVLGYIKTYDESIDKNSMKIYLYNSARLKTENCDYLTANGLSSSEVEEILRNKENPITSTSETIFSYTPALYVINNNSLYDFRCGKDEVARYIFNLDEFKDESFSYLTSLNYDDFIDFKLNDLNLFYDLNYSKYAIYLYYSTCPYCIKNKKFMISYFLDKEKTNVFPVFFFNIYKKSTELGEYYRSLFKKNEESLSNNEIVSIMKENNVNKLENTYFNSVPSLYVISENKFSDLVSGVSSIQNYLSN